MRTKVFCFFFVVVAGLTRSLQGVASKFVASFAQMAQRLVQKAGEGVFEYLFVFYKDHLAEIGNEQVLHVIHTHMLDISWSRWTV